MLTMNLREKNRDGHFKMMRRQHVININKSCLLWQELSHLNMIDVFAFVCSTIKASIHALKIHSSKLERLKLQNILM